MKKIHSRLVLAMLVLFTFSQCKKQDDDLTTNAPPSYMPGPKVYHDKMKTEFGSFLAKAIAKEEGIRTLLKAEALKMFNNDYEVLYYMIKDRPVRDGKTFRDLLLEHSGNKALLKEIEKELPLLTILIPELPQNSFSAANWDTETELPVVALRVWSDKGVPMLAPMVSHSIYRLTGYPVLLS